MTLSTLAFCIRGYLSADFNETDRKDIREYALANLEQRGIDTGAMQRMTLPELLSEIESLAITKRLMAA